MGGREGAAVEAFENTLGYSSRFGKLWYLTVAFRVMITVLVGTSLYANQESTFHCATQQHICTTVCFNQFMPINFTRYWQFQTVLLGLVAFGFTWVTNAEKTLEDALDNVKKLRDEKKMRRKLCQSQNGKTRKTNQRK